MNAYKFTGILAAVLMLIQATIWIIFSILGITAYSGQITVSVDATLFMKVFYTFYFNKYYTDMSSQYGLTSPYGVLIWMCVYLAINVLWLIACIVWLVDLTREDRPPPSLYMWASVTAMILVLDLTATIWFGIDVATLKDVQNVDVHFTLSSALMMTLATLKDVQNVVVHFTLSSALMMTLAAKGFVLYLVNAGLLAMVITFAVQQQKRKSAGKPAMQNAYLNPAMWPDMQQQTASSDTWNTPASQQQISRDTGRYPTFVNPPMSPVYDDMPPRAQPPFILQDPPKPRAAASEEPPKYLIPEPDYSPLMNRAYKPMLPIRPALKKSPHMGRTVF